MDPCSTPYLTSTILDKESLSSTYYILPYHSYYQDNNSLIKYEIPKYIQQT